MSEKPYIFLLALCLLLAPDASAQRIGVVLSGGGAKGVAHVGLLKALEENNIPIDYIAGTSMGAIIGGMYASGFSPDSIEKIVTSPEFQSWALGTIQEEYNFYFKQLPENASWVSVKFTVDSVWQPQLPTSLVSPVQMDFAGVQYLSSVNVASKGNFDSLFIPFRCVAADIERKEAVVFSKGPLFPAIRASMTYPFVFKPIRIDGRLLFDGGIYNNFPVDVMQSEFDPDFIIGSVVAQNFKPPTEDNIRSQVENLLVSKTDYIIDEEFGILIKPDIPQVGVTDFSRSHEILDSGYVATQKVIAQIKERVSREVSLEERKARRDAFAKRTPPVIIDRIFFRGMNEAQMDYIYRLLYERKPTPIEEIKVEYFKLLAEEHIELLVPTIEYNPESGYYDLYLDVTLDKDLVLQFGGNVSSSPVNLTFIEAQYRRLGYKAYTTIANAYVGRFYNSVHLMSRMGFPTKTPFFLEGSYTLNNYNFFQTNTLFFQDQTPAYLRINQNFLNLKGGLPARYSGKILLGATTGITRYDYYQTNQFARTDTTDQTTLSFFSPYLVFERNTLNRKQFPNEGTFFSIGLRYITGLERHTPGSTSFLTLGSRNKHDWFQLRIDYQNFFAKTNAITWGFFSELMLSNKSLFSNYTSSLLTAPSFDQVPETRGIFLPRYRANNFGVVGIKGIYSLSRNTDLRMEAYIFQPVREILAGPDHVPYLSKIFDRTYFLLSTSLVANTRLGPASLTLNFFDRYEVPFSLSLNFGYLIFNDNPLH
ncbi:MAG: patatin-like phospholipase family protein [Bacteroidales bacterium]|jgi:NTE family protein|nr:patatin-like phospholipase family protein [Bacteroidales bacterium]NLM93223.1 patatin-like phospholipase family protein [Bacteroidales bacterium]